jgi:hypothetical protein
MGYPLFTNNAATGLVYPITSSATTLYVNGGSGFLFPSPTGGNYFMITLINALTGNMEIVKCTARSGDVFTVVRAQEGTTAQAFAVGDAVQLRITAGSLSTFANPTVVNSVAADTGISVSSSTGNVTIGNTGVVAVNAGSGITLSGSSGTVTISSNVTSVANATNAANLITTNFSIKEVSGKLYFYYGTTQIASLDSSGNFTALGNLTGTTASGTSSPTP